MGFSTLQPSLHELLNGVAKGEIQLPDFQRGWVWDDQHIKSLIASISLGYPIGSVMFLEAGGVPFKPRLFEGVELASHPKPKVLVLDGQQRLTSMYLALKSGKPVPTKTEKGLETKRLYFIDIKNYMDPKHDRENSIISISEKMKQTSYFGRIVEFDLSAQSLQFERKMMPVSVLFDAKSYRDWEDGYEGFYENDKDSRTLFKNFRSEIFRAFESFKIPVIQLTDDTKREAVCQVFEKVNTGGVTLTIFELMTATFASKDFNLRENWDSRKSRFHAKQEVLKAVDGTDFLTAVTLLDSFEQYREQKSAVSCKRTDVLDLSLEKYQELEAKVEQGFLEAAHLLLEEKVFDEKVLPYTTQLIPLAAISAHLGKKMNNLGVRKKILQWYWCGVFGELYGSANEYRYAMDLPDVINWIESGNDEPRTVRDSNFAPTRLLSLQTRQSAAYKGMMVLLMMEGCEDFQKGTPVDLNLYLENLIDIHHVFPRVWCEKAEVPRAKWNSVVNKAPLTASTNKFIGGDSPSKYLKKLQNKVEVPEEELDRILKSHLIPADQLRQDDFHGFFIERAKSFLSLIENKTGKIISGKDSDETVKAFGASLGGG